MRTFIAQGEAAGQGGDRAAVMLQVAAQRLPHDWMKIGGICMPPPLAQQVLRVIENDCEKILVAHGLDAFAMPRSAALAHEVGHCVVAAAQGMAIKDVAVHRCRGAFGTAWGGVTNEYSGWSFSTDTATRDVINRARYILGGIAGENVLDAHVKAGSSLGEVIAAQIIIGGVVEDRPDDFQHRSGAEVWHRVWAQTFGIIKANEGVARDLIKKLDRTGKLQGKPLQASLRRVQCPR